MRIILILCSICLLLQSCAWLGTRSFIKNKPTQKLSHVAVVIAQDEVFETRGNDAEYFYITKTLAEELAKKNFFRFTILDRKYSAGMLDQLEIGLLGTELANKNYDGYLICTVLPKRGNYKVELILTQTSPLKEIIFVSHHTGIGNTYAWYPGSSSQLNDATRSAIEALEKRWKQINF